MTTNERIQLLNLLESVHEETDVSRNQDAGWLLTFKDADFDDPDECVRWLLDTGVFTRLSDNRLAVDWNKRRGVRAVLMVEKLEGMHALAQRLKYPFFPPIVEAEKPGLWRFDWAAFDAELQRRHEVRPPASWHPRNQPYRRALPDEYEHMIAAMRFELPEGYREEIERNMKRCQDEWSIERPFDTIIRDSCLTPAIEHARIVFMLAYDYLVPKERAVSATVALLQKASVYKLWVHQTGKGAAWGYAGFEKACRFWRATDQERADAERFVEALREWHEGK